MPLIKEKKQMNKTLSTWFDNGVSSILVFLCKLLTGVQAHWQVKPENKVRIYYANHSSHLDSIVVWSCMPKALRSTIHPVAAKDYWLKNKLHRYFAERIFRSILISRKPNPEKNENILIHLTEVLKNGESLLLFPEGTRNDNEDLSLAEFKGGLYHLARQFPEAELIPVYLENLNRVLPKGSKLTVPIICYATFGPALAGLFKDETKEDFLNRAKHALEALMT